MSKGLFAGRYQLDRVLGVGATATVHLARDTQGGTAVAIKILRQELAQSTATGRFLKEIRRTEQLDHPNILRVLDSGEFDGKPYFVLPYMEGGTLRAKMQQESQLTFEETIAILRPIAQALDYAHTRGLIHRDVKPENILFTSDQACLGDFGIARAFETTFGTGGTTSSDTIRGTYAYMSPEQAAGGKNLDGRSDIYSLACVAYEMITGMQAFIGPTPEVIVAQRFNFSPREVRAYRPSAPPEVDVALAKAFAMSPADRYQTATEFLDALGVAISSPVARKESSTTPRIVAVFAGAAVTIGLAFLVALKGSAIGRRTSDFVRLDTTRVAVLPLERDSARLPVWRDDDLLQQGLARWRGVSVVDQFQVSDAIRQAGLIRSLDEAALVARRLGAGRFIRGRVSPFGDGWRATVSLYDAADAHSLYQKAQSIPPDFGGAMAAYASLADSLLLRGAASDSVPLATAGTRSLPAAQAFNWAQLALDNWDLARADTGFQMAVSFDPDYARASLWLAQVRAWEGLPRNAWGTVAERAAAMMSQLTDRERQLTNALVYLSRGDFSRSCAMYDSLQKRNDRDFAAWFGLGQCESSNRTVIRSSATPSGWAFRGNMHRAMGAYAKAFEILPSVHRGYERGAFERLRVLLLLSNRVYTGFGEGDSATFLARPALIGDTLILVPYPWQQVMKGGASVTPPGFADALERRRLEFRRIAGSWSSAFPGSAEAKQAVALALELIGDASSIDTLRLARSLADTSRRLRLAAQEVVLHVKFGAPDDLAMLERAESLADSLLEGQPSPSQEAARILAPVAALFGRCRRGDSLATIGQLAPGTYRVSNRLFAKAQVALLRTALGCDDHPELLKQLANAVDAETRAVPAERNRLDAMLLFRPVLFAQVLDPELLVRLSKSTGSHQVRAAERLAHADAAAARREMDSVSASSGPSAPTPDLAYASARLYVMLGDTTKAIEELDKTLHGLRFYAPEVLTDDLGAAGALVRAIGLRAQLASARNDSKNARRWAVAGAALRSRADRGTQPRLEQLKAIANRQ